MNNKITTLRPTDRTLQFPQAPNQFSIFPNYIIYSPHTSSAPLTGIINNLGCRCIRQRTKEEEEEEEAFAVRAQVLQGHRKARKKARPLHCTVLVHFPSRPCSSHVIQCFNESDIDNYPIMVQK
jgi:hypothetical protein